jgi:hypothetical protein
MMSKPGSIFILLSARALPASGPSGIRRKAWRDLTVGAYAIQREITIAKIVSILRALNPDLVEALLYELRNLSTEGNE